MNSVSSSAQSLWQQALTLHQQGRLTQAQALYQQVLQQQPQHFDALHMLGVLALQQGHPLQAVDWMQQALILKADHADLYINLGSALHALHATEAALAAYETAAALAPDKPQIWFNQGNLFQQLDQLPRAVEAYQQALALAPDYAQALTNLGLCWQKLSRPDLALNQFAHVQSLLPHDVQAHHNTGNALKDLHRYQDAIASYDQALALQPTDVATLYNKGTVLQETLQLQAAIDCYKRVMALDPLHAKAPWNLSLCLLLLGRLTQAWPLYEARWQVSETQLQRPQYNAPAWTGQSLATRTILVYAEQGLGDCLQFSRYLPMLEQQGAHVILQVPTTLHALLRPAINATLIDTQESAPAFDFHCSLLDLPRLFNTSSNTIPGRLAQLKANAQDAAQWQKRLASLAPHQPLIGLVWQGSWLHLNDANRSVPLKQLIDHLPSGPCYVSLQKDIRDSELEQLDDAGILHFEQALHDFSDTAALAACMHRVVSVDTSVAHLCGSLDIDTVLLLPYVADWRWLAHGQRNAWYPSLTLVRQDDSRLWSSALSQLPPMLQRRTA